MKKWFVTLLGVGIFLGGCAPTIQKQDQVVDEGAEEQTQTGIIPSFQVSEEYYRVLLPYEPSASRGAVVQNINNTLNIEEFETGLMRLSQEFYSTEDYYFREGQLLDSDTISSWLGRQSSEDEEGTLKLNPEIAPGPDQEERPDFIKRHEDSPLYLSHIIEQNYLIKSRDDTVKLGGISIGLALNSVYYYRDSTYTYFEYAIPESEIIEQGKKMAEKVVSTLRTQYADAADVPIFVALYVQGEKSSTVPGNYFASSFADSGKGISKWNDVEEKHYAFNISSEANELYREDVQYFNNFKDEIENYFPNYNGVVGTGFYRDGQLSKLKIDIPIQFYGKAELVGFAQYVTGTIMDQFPDFFNIEVNVTSVNGQEILFIREPGDKEPFVHIYE
ncbi:hypothetical protein Q75_00985 [Bacillus coahuilensis p1.1.43]|uniref:Calcium ABC transporter ATPase n=2 Tax=Bacillus coahuilensis TaxID=408580 RepID=A0A147KCG5_9BACI|nr:CamS family sex pheromone protein [Bacillus coahuilensis]KUP09236.1 hypothetical protein Q75_00985 [Bacillus coahuilensis p1.1.43]